MIPLLNQKYPNSLIAQFSALIFCVIASWVSDSNASDSATQSSSKICTSLRIINNEEHWGLVGIRKPETVQEHCPAAHAYMAVYPPGGLRRDAEKIPVWGSCCPVPEDLLLDEHVFALENCPENWIATGAKQAMTEHNKTAAHGKVPGYFLNIRDQYLRCTRVNTEKYSIVGSSQGVRVGNAEHFRVFFDTITSRGVIPPGLRYGLGRRSKTEWASNFCVGQPWGSVLVGKSSKYCEGFSFAEISTRQLENDDTFLLYEDCLAVDDYESSHPRCIDKPSAKE